MTKRTALLAALVAAALPVCAQDHSFTYSYSFDLGDMLAETQLVQAQLPGHDGDAMREHAQHMSEWAENFAAEMQGSMAMVFGDRVGRGKVVKGAPYSADVVTETNQKLFDGNVITHKRLSRIYRDGEGRTRQETVRDNVVRSIYIFDPTTNMSYTLIPSSKVAVGVQRRPSKVSIDKETVSIEDGRTTTVIRRGGKDKEGPGYSSEVRIVTIDGGDAKNVDIVVPTPPTPPTPPAPGRGIAPVPPVPPVPPIPPMMFHNLGGLGKGTTTTLGNKSFDGVNAEGKQTTWTIPAGQVGNRDAIVVTNEAWYSPDLQVSVYTRYNDPRNAETIYRLASIKRGEPSPDLFKVPADYKLKEKRSETPMAPPAPKAPPPPK